MELNFKRLVIFFISSIVVILLLSFSPIPSSLMPKELIDWSDNLIQENFFAYICAFLTLILLIISSFMLLKFSSTGRSMFLWSIIISFAVGLFIGPTIYDPLTAIIGGLNGLSAGAILILMYSSPLSEKFN